MMKHFAHMDASSVEEASAATKDGTAMLIAGGTDLLGTLKDEILRDYPETIVNLKTIEGLDYIDEADGMIKIGALTKLDAVASSDIIMQKAAALAQAAGRAASPTLRGMGTIAGNICQMHRCWYFRVPNNRFDCFRKGGSYCAAMLGDNRYNSIFGNDGGCYAASSQETAPALIALGATIVTNERSVEAADFFAAAGPRSNVLEDGEIVTEIQVPETAAKSAFTKYALRKSIDFNIVNCAIAQEDDGYHVVLGGVYPTPLRMTAAEEALANGVDETSAAAAGDAAVADAQPLSGNAWKVEIARTLVKRTALALLDA